MTPPAFTSNGRQTIPASIRQPSWYYQSQLPSSSVWPTLRFCPPQLVNEPMAIDPDKQVLDNQTHIKERLQCYKPCHRERFLQLQTEADHLFKYLQQVNQQRSQPENGENSHSELG